MSELLLRGTDVNPRERIRKTVASGDDWQICLTSRAHYALVVTEQLFMFWSSAFSLPTGLFARSAKSGFWIFLSRGDYLISSLENGPYPSTYLQIEAFSIAFKTARGLYPLNDMGSAVYIEEYSLLLPTRREELSPSRNGLAYGTWIAGGAGVSIDSFEKVCRLTSWLSPRDIAQAAALAGFAIENTYDEATAGAQGAALLKGSNQSTKPTPVVPREKFALVGRPELEQFFRENIIDIIAHKERYRRVGISFPGATILHGPSGCGKTYAVEQLAAYLGWPRFDIDSDAIASPYIHDTGKKIAAVFDDAIQNAPSVLVIDEMEAYLSSRTQAASSGTHHLEEVAEFLRRLPGAVSKEVLIFGMTNMVDLIDPAILRRGRFDHVIEVKMPNDSEVRAVFDEQLRGLPVADNVNTRDIAALLEGHPLSDVAFVVREAGRISVQRSLAAITDDCLKDAFEQLPRNETRFPIGFAPA